MLSDDDLLAGRSDRFATAIQAVDAANADDPETLELDGELVPKELTHARMMCDWVLRLDPDADEVQLLAARAHHLRRWTLPRSEYAEGRAGYLRWRAEQKRRHAAEVGAIMRDAGYDDAAVERVGAIVQKRGLASDPRVQTHEDALCIVFLATQFEPVAAQLGDAKMVDVLAKTLRKMSADGIAAARTLDLSAEAVALVGQATQRLADAAD